MTTWESNGHVTDDVMWPWMARSWHCVTLKVKIGVNSWSGFNCHWLQLTMRLFTTSQSPVTKVGN